MLLHGMHNDARIFYGEREPLKLVEAVSLDLIPTDGIDIAVLGCCWGALIVGCATLGVVIMPKPAGRACGATAWAVIGAAAAGA